MDRKLNPRTAAWFYVLPVALLVLSAGCAAPTPARSVQPTATQPEKPTPTRTTPATAIEAPTVTAAPSDTPEPTAASIAENTSGEEITYNLPVKGSETAPVTIVEFSDYL